MEVKIFIWSQNVYLRLKFIFEVKIYIWGPNLFLRSNFIFEVRVCFRVHKFQVQYFPRSKIPFCLVFIFSPIIRKTTASFLLSMSGEKIMDLIPSEKFRKNKKKNSIKNWKKIWPINNFWKIARPVPYVCAQSWKNGAGWNRCRPGETQMERFILFWCSRCFQTCYNSYIFRLRLKKIKKNK